jgi:hypothetical protein
MKVAVRRGCKLILIGNLDNARVRKSNVGTTFKIPVNTCHVEWWKSDRLEEIEGVGPVKTERVSPETSLKTIGAGEIG